MSIFLDPRSGSGILEPYFKPYDIPVETVYLDAADIAFCSNGPDGTNPMIGFERKILTDAIGSMRNERFMGEQLPKLLESYPLSITIVLEGIWRAGPATGAIEVKGYGRGEWIPVRVGSRTVMYRELDHWLATLEHKIGFETGRQFSVVRTADEAQTAAYIVSRYKWWNDKSWEAHDSYKTIYSPDVPHRPGRRGFSIPQPGPVEEVSCRFPGVREKAWNFGKRFESVYEMVNADQKQLAEVDGIGKKGAATIYDWLRRITRRSDHNGGNLGNDAGGNHGGGGWTDAV